MNELSDRYEDYVQTMNRERSEIMKQNRSHIKLLTSKLLFQILNESMHQRKKNAFSSILETSNYMASHTKRVQRFARIFIRYTDETKRHYLRKWYRKAMNFTHENYKQKGLIDFNVNKKTKTMAFLKWRQAFLKNRAMFEHKLQACKLLQATSSTKSDHGLRRAMCKWRDFLELR